MGILAEEGGPEVVSCSLGSSKGLNEELGVSTEAGDKETFDSEVGGW